MRIEPDFFLIFYEELLKKFIEKVYKVERNDQWEEKEIWNHKFACENQFDVSKYNHFFRKKISVLNDKPESIPITPRTLIKALNYIGVELKDEKVLLSGIVLKERENKHAILLWEQFKKAYPKQNSVNTLASDSIKESTQKTKDTTKKESENFEKLFLEMVSKNPDVFNPSEIKKIFSSFFSHIQDKNYYDAWIMLSPEFQKKSIWDGSPNNFEYSYSNVEKLKITNINKFSYHPKKIVFTVDFYEQGSLVDMMLILKVIRDDPKFNAWNQSILHNLLEVFRKILDKFFSNAENSGRYNWISQKGNGGLFDQRVHSETTKEEFLDLIEKNWKSHDFQKAFLVALKTPHFSSLMSYLLDKLIKYDQFCQGSVICVYEHERWLIDSLSIEENMWVSGIY